MSQFTPSESSPYIERLRRPSRRRRSRWPVEAVLGYLAVAAVGLTLSVWLITWVDFADGSRDTPAFPSGPQQTTSDLVVFDALVLYADYSENEIAADQAYRNKLLAVRGKVMDIGRDLTGSAYVTLNAGRMMFGVQCLFSKQHEARLAKLSKGQYLVIAGTCKGKLGNVLVDDCWFYAKDSQLSALPSGD